jgi:hypothetical protein
MRTATFVLAFSLIGESAIAQITDPEHRMRWFNLQRLATETAEIELCSIVNLKDQRYQVAYYRAASDTAAAIEKYLAQYPEGRAKQEAPEAYRYRVWYVAITAAKEKARSIQQMNEITCRTMLLTGR